MESTPNLNKPANPTPPSRPHRASGRGRGWLIGAIALIIVGGAIIVYPFIPGIRYAISKPTPKLPYQNQLSATNDGQTALATLPSLPKVGDKPVPADNRLVIPSIGVDMPILEGPTQKVLDRGGIWHIPDTSDPSRGGNTVLSGHRWQYLPPSSTTLYLLDKVQLGEPVIIYWQGQEYDYRVANREIIDPSRTDILNDTTEPKLTIFTCAPLFSTKQRLVLYGELILF